MQAGRAGERRSARPDPAVRAEGTATAREGIREAKRTGRPDLDLSRLQLVVLPPELAQLTNLRQRDLGGNQLTTLPEEFGQLANLQLLDLDENPLVEPLPGLLAEGIPALLAHRQGLATPPRPIGGGTT
jgi:hypothetical protein